MKKFLQIVGLVVFGSCASVAQDDPKGWFISTAGLPPVIQPANGNTAMQPMASALIPAASLDMPAQPYVPTPISLDFTRHIQPTTMEPLTELARGLDGDWRKCYLFVRDHIRHTPYPGILRGPERTLLDREGNDADQALLLLALLKASGHEATILYAPVSEGGFRIPVGGTPHGYDAASWLGVVQTENTSETLRDVTNTVAFAKIPHSNVTGTGNAIQDMTLCVDHYWVGFTQEGQEYWLDPSFKPHKRENARDILADMAYDRNALINAAGGTVDANSVTRIAQDLLEKHLRTLYDRLREAWENPYASAVDFLGRHVVVPHAAGCHK